MLSQYGQCGLRPFVAAKGMWHHAMNQKVDLNEHIHTHTHTQTRAHTHTHSHAEIYMNIDTHTHRGAHRDTSCQEEVFPKLPSYQCCKVSADYQQADCCDYQQFSDFSVFQLRTVSRTTLTSWMLLSSARRSCPWSIIVPQRYQCSRV